MARHKTYQHSETTAPLLDISSLIDVCFLLLIYFLVTSTIMPRESDLSAALAGERFSDSEPRIDPLFIRIEAAGGISTGLGAAKLGLDSDAGDRRLPLLASQLEMYAGAARAAASAPLVQIDADDEARQQRVIDVLNALEAAGIHAVTFTDLARP